MTGYHTMSEEVIRLREEITEQYRALAQMKKWLRNMAMIFLNQLQMQKKLSNGYTSDI